MSPFRICVSTRKRIWPTRQRITNSTFKPVNFILTQNFTYDYKTTNTKEVGIVLIFYRSAVKRKRIFYHVSSSFSRLRESAGLHSSYNKGERTRAHKNRLEIELKCHLELIEVIELECSSQSCSVICISICSNSWPKQHSTETNIYIIYLIGIN